LAIPLPYLAIQLGWLVTEVGRQPWIVYGLVRTANAVSPIAVSQVATTLVGFVLLYGFLGVSGFTLIAKKAKKGPAGEEEDEPQSAEAESPSAA
jgi:cytochrome d ubiquinol oxidase subunit I